MPAGRACLVAGPGSAESAVPLLCEALASKMRRGARSRRFRGEIAAAGLCGDDGGDTRRIAPGSGPSPGLGERNKRKTSALLCCARALGGRLTLRLPLHVARHWRGGRRGAPRARSHNANHSNPPHHI